MYEFISSCISDALLKFNCSDGDSGNNGRFSLKVTSGDPVGVFALANADLYVDSSLMDYESLEDQDYRYTLTVEAVDKPDDGPSRTAVALVIIQVHLTMWISFMLDQDYPVTV